MRDVADAFTELRSLSLLIVAERRRARAAVDWDIDLALAGGHGSRGPARQGLLLFLVAHRRAVGEVGDVAQRRLRFGARGLFLRDGGWWRHPLDEIAEMAAGARDQRIAAATAGAEKSLRPVLMAVVGLIPVMLATGVGADVMKRLSSPMFGGLISLMVLTLLVVPAVYAAIDRTHKAGAPVVPASGDDRSPKAAKGAP